MNRWRFLLLSLGGLGWALPCTAQTAPSKWLSYDGATKQAIIDAFNETPFRLACTATPAPNDYMELGNHAEFLGVMTRVEMLSMFFVHDGGDTSQRRIKGHAQIEFWKWLASWATPAPSRNAPVRGS